MGLHVFVSVFVVTEFGFRFRSPGLGLRGLRGFGNCEERSLSEGRIDEEGKKGWA